MRELRRGAEPVKVGYVDLNGYHQTAYLDTRDGEFWTGRHRHTDEPVRVYWNDDDEVRAWVEVPYEA